MHTATQLSDDHFDFEVGGRPAGLPDVLDWHRGDRFAIVVDTPLGALGASSLIQAAITAFWDEFRATEQWPPTYGEIYPDVLVLHVGRGWGEFSSFDFWPEDREIVVPADPAGLLAAVGLHAITHLAVPDRPGLDLEHRTTQTGPVARRLRHGFAYAPSGRVDRPDLTIRAAPQAEENVQGTLYPDEAAAEFAVEYAEDPEFLRYLAVAKERRHEVHDDVRRRIETERVGLVEDGRVLETYRRVSTPQSLALLNASAASVRLPVT